jgi:23S rRNA (uracil1939-C5)-methyltransferase
MRDGGVTHVIAAMGASGDGLAEHDGARIHVPFALPGERVNLAIHGDRADVTAILEASPERVAPVCAHFTQCGGCALQHWHMDAYREWKRGLVVRALAGAGVAAEIGDLFAAPVASRRRAVFSAKMTAEGLAFGFRRAMSHAVEDISACPVIVPAITARLDALRALARQLAPLANGAFPISVTATPAGLDIHADKIRPPADALRKALVQSALNHGFARLAVSRDILVTVHEPVLMLDGIAMTPPPGGFLQAAVDAERLMQGIAISYLDGARRVADLFCGSGTFALPLARRSTVHAVESEAAAVAALERAWRNAGGAGIKVKPLTVERRDLFQRPLTAKELNGFDAVVIDPPRAGAEAQMAQLANSTVKRIVAVSCNPVTLARDLAILGRGGFKVLAVTPIDQFTFTPHVEAVALLAR